MKRKGVKRKFEEEMFVSNPMSLTERIRGMQTK